MNVEGLVEAIVGAREEWDAFVRQVAPSDLERPGVCGNWSMKDVVAHIAWHEREMIGLLETHVLAGSPWWLLPTDERNDKIYEQNKDRAAEDVLREAAETFPHLLRAIKGLADEDLNDPARFADMPPDWIPWRIIAQNTYEHYEVHLESARR